jgi:hypothetical protein
MRTATISFLIVLPLVLLGLQVGYSRAQADAAAEVLADAGVDLQPVTATTSRTTPSKPVLVDPVDNPTLFAKDAVAAFRAGRWAFLIVLGLFGLARGLLFVATRYSVTWLKRATPSLVAVSAALASVGASISAGAGVDVWATVGALLMAVALYLSPAPVAKVS